MGVQKRAGVGSQKIHNGRESLLRVLQADSQTPIWMPVGLLSSNVTATAWPGNTSAGILESRWLEIFPVWEEEHKVRVGGDETCGEAGDGDGDGAACGRPVASPPVVIDDGAPWLMKGSPGVFLGNISDSGAGKVRLGPLQ